MRQYGRLYQPIDCNRITPITANSRNQDWLAIACAITAVAIWGWWMSATRIAAQQGVAPIDVALMRYSVPALLLLPVWYSTLKKLQQAPRWSVIAMLGWGAPFLWLVTASLKESSVVTLATIVPCTMPVFAVIAERVIFRKQPTRNQIIGFTLITLAAALVIINALFGGGISVTSLGLMFMAAAGWACYVVSFRHTGLTAAQGAAWVCTASTLIILLIKLVSGSEILPLSTDQIIFNAVAQGFISGFVAVLLYTTAIGRLGSARAASFSVLMPALGSLFAWMWLGENPSWFNLFALLLGTAGVAVINGIFTNKQTSH